MVSPCEQSRLRQLARDTYQARPEGVPTLVTEACYLSFAQRRLENSCTPFKAVQEGKGLQKAFPYGRFMRPVALVREWLDAVGITEGPIFRPVSRAGRVRVRTPRLTTQAAADIIIIALGPALEDRLQGQRRAISGALRPSSWVAALAGLKAGSLVRHRPALSLAASRSSLF
jgi:hypothetical protein